MDIITMNDQHTEIKNNLPYKRYEWTWNEECSTSSIKLSDNKLDVKFHPIYSTGTAVVKGNKPLRKDSHHFWEILILTPLYGTDVMIGVGSANAEINDASDIFCSLLGRDQESWGFSYKGYLQHDGKTCKYGTSFGQGDMIGIHLDTWAGTLQFFCNRKPLGIAFTRLNNVILYPLISSTMAQCVMTLTYSNSIVASLQTSCLAILSPSQRRYLSKTFPGLRYLCYNIFADILRKRIDNDNENDESFDLTTEYILDDYDYALVGFGRKKKKRLSHDKYGNDSPS